MLREQPITRKMIYGTLRIYKCRICDKRFRDYYLAKNKRICPKCVKKGFVLNG